MQACASKIRLLKLENNLCLCQVYAPWSVLYGSIKILDYFAISRPSKIVILDWFPKDHIWVQVKMFFCARDQNWNFEMLIFESQIWCVYKTYGPQKAVAEVSNHNEPIGRKSGIQLV